MSSFRDRRAFLGLLAASPLVLAPLVLAGCGFRSALSSQSGVQGTESSLRLMKLIYVHQATYGNQTDIRLAQGVRNGLLNRVGEPGRPAFSLTMTLSRGTRGAGITSTDRTTRITVEGKVDFVLYALNQEEKAPPREVYRGTETSWSSYDRIDSPFSDRIAERDLDDQIAIQLADQIFNRIAGWFVRASQGTVPG